MPGKSVRRVEAGLKALGNDGAVGDVLTMEVRARRTRGMARSKAEGSPPEATI